MGKRKKKSILHGERFGFKFIKQLANTNDERLKK